jgi:tRNA threonylcarbamoyladenosine biosynthesis protein TsaE
MSTDLTWQTSTDNSGQTEQLAEKIASNLRGGEVIELSSDLGGGKTTFTRGLARGVGSLDHVSSPTFKISNVYKGPKLTIHHFDFYRLHDDTLIAHELSDVKDDTGAVVIIEWGERLSSTLPESRLKIEIKSTGENTRTIRAVFPKELGYLMEGLK